MTTAIHALSARDSVWRGALTRLNENDGRACAPIPCWRHSGANSKAYGWASAIERDRDTMASLNKPLSYRRLIFIMMSSDSNQKVLIVPAGDDIGRIVRLLT